MSRGFVHDFVRPAAGFHTAAAVAAVGKQYAGMNALTAFADAHVAVHEIFQFKIRVGRFQFAQFLQGHFTADNDAADIVFLQFGDSCIVVRIHHDGSVHRQIEFKFFHNLSYSQILN